MGRKSSLWHGILVCIYSSLLYQFSIYAARLLSIFDERFPLLRRWVRDLELFTQPISGVMELAVRPFRYRKFSRSTLIAPRFFMSEGSWQCAGYDSSSHKWRLLPRAFSSFLPPSCMPDSDLFKEYLVCSHGGIICTNLSKGAEERLVVLNPLTGKWRELPPLNHRHNIVLMHLVDDAATSPFRVVVAGSARAGDGRLFRVTEEFDSRTRNWELTGDMPGPDYALNEYQTGVLKDGYLYCIAFLDQEAGKGILRYNVGRGEWSIDCTIISFSRNSAIRQFVDCWGEFYLFSEQEHGNNVEHWIDRVEWDSDTSRLKNVMRMTKAGGRSLEVYPECICIPYKKHHVCVFDTIEHSGIESDVRSGGQSKVLQAPPANQGLIEDQTQTLWTLRGWFRLTDADNIEVRCRI